MKAGEELSQCPIFMGPKRYKQRLSRARTGLRKSAAGRSSPPGAAGRTQVGSLAAPGRLTGRDGSGGSFLQWARLLLSSRCSMPWEPAGTWRGCSWLSWREWRAGTGKAVRWAQLHGGLWWGGRGSRRVHSSLRSSRSWCKSYNTTHAR